MLEAFSSDNQASKQSRKMLGVMWEKSNLQPALSSVVCPQPQFLLSFFFPHSHIHFIFKLAKNNII